MSKSQCPRIACDTALLWDSWGATAGNVMLGMPCLPPRPVGPGCCRDTDFFFLDGF